MDIKVKETYRNQRGIKKFAKMRNVCSMMELEVDK
jgi:hypothetical protein